RHTDPTRTRAGVASCRRAMARARRARGAARDRRRAERRRTRATGATHRRADRRRRCARDADRRARRALSRRARAAGSDHGCAAVLALAGERPAELIGSGPVTLDGELGRALCSAITTIAPAVLLGDELVARLRAWPLLEMLGDPTPRSLDEVAARMPADLTYV